jgi:hypothetical protein
MMNMKKLFWCNYFDYQGILKLLELILILKRHRQCHNFWDLL